MPGDAIVMRLDQIRFGGPAGFDGIGIDGALPQNPMAIEEMVAMSRMRSCTCTNCSPMMWRLPPDRVMPASARRNSLPRHLHLKGLRPVLRTCARTNSVSPSRIRPVST